LYWHIFPLAKAKLHKEAEAEDMMIEILGLEYKQEVEIDIPVYQKPLNINHPVHA
jgi:hypothetical protein